MAIQVIAKPGFLIVAKNTILSFNIVPQGCCMLIYPYLKAYGDLRSVSKPTEAKQAFSV